MSINDQQLAVPDIAQTLVSGLNLPVGSKVLIDTDKDNIDLMSRVSSECRQYGLHPIIVYHDDILLTDKQNNTNIMSYYSDVANVADAFITVSMEISSVPELRTEHRKNYNNIVGNLVRKKSIPWVHIDSKFMSMVPTIISCDQSETNVIGMELKRKLLEAETITLKSSNKDELYFDIRDCNIFIDDGIISKKDKTDNWNIVNWPTGELSICIHGNHVNGCVEVLSCGKLIRLVIDDNKIIYPILNNGYSNRVCEIGVGLNMGVPDNVICEKKYRDVHIGIGSWRSNDDAPGHVDYFVNEPTILIDDIEIMPNQVANTRL